MHYGVALIRYSANLMDSRSPATADSAVEPAAGANTSEQHCPICLEDFEDKSFIDTCFHILFQRFPGLKASTSE